MNQRHLQQATACSIALLAGLCAAPPAAATRASAGPTSGAPVAPLPLDIVSQATARVPPPSLVASAGPASGQVGLVFTSGRTGYLAAVPRPQSSGYAAGATSELQRTTDGGASWTTVWRGHGIVLHWLGAQGPALAASGIGRRGPLLVESTDGGTSWHEVPVTISFPSMSAQAAQGGGADWYWATSALYFVNRELGFAYPDPMYGQAAPWPRVLLRTTDGGRQWAAVPFLGGTPSGGLTFVSSAHGFATGLSAVSATGPAPRRCTSQIWQSSDAGASWQPVPGTCVGYLLTSLAFPTPTQGYAGGGNYAFSFAPQLALLATADGGRNWSQVFSAPESTSALGTGPGGPFAELQFYDPEHGLALAGGCTPGANGPCQGQVWRTDDGGRSWSPEGAEGALVALAGPRGAWAAGGALWSEVLWRSGDRGRSWAPVASSGKEPLSGFLAAGGRLWVGTEAGQFMSQDAGHSWQGVPAATLAAEGGPFGAQVAELGGQGLVVVAQTGTATVWVSDNGGRSGRAFAVPVLGRGGVSAVYFASPEDGLALGPGSCAALKRLMPLKPPISLPLRPTTVAATHDGGRHWQDVGTVDVWGYGGLAYSGALAIVTQTCTKGIATSTDGGRKWTYWATPASLASCQQPSVYAETVVLSCPSYAHGASTLRLLVSEDAGRHWSAYELRGPGAKDVQGTVASGPGVLWAFGPTAGEVWRSSDGGANWGPVNLALPVKP